LFIKVHTFEHLYHAFKKARIGTKSEEVSAFNFNLENELITLSEKLKNKTYKPAKYKYFTIHDPKERIISVAPFVDRVVHHAVVALLEPIYEKLFIDNSFATRKNKGTHLAIKTAQIMLRKNVWYLKADVRKYFDSIKHDILIDLLRQKIKDNDFMQLVETIIRNTENQDGLPIGNLTSQFFANVYLHGFDNYVLRVLKPAAYIRYMDDFVLFDNDKNSLKSMLLHICSYMQNNLSLTLKDKAVMINKYTHGLSFLGVRIFENTVRVKQQNLRRSLKRLRYKYYLYAQGKITEEQFLATANSITAHLSAYNTQNLMKKIKFWHKNY